MKRINRPVIILIEILIPVACAIVSFYMTTIAGSLYDSGRFIKWQSLGSPPEKATKILGICANNVCVQTKSKQIYTFNCREFSPACWEEAKGIEIEEPQFGPCWFSFVIKEPPDGVIQSVRTNSCDSAGGMQRNYVLMRDGSVWMWHHTINDLQGILWVLLSIPLAAISFFLGVGFVLTFMPAILRKWEAKI